jgi:anti-sigma B factor antagonist
MRDVADAVVLELSGRITLGDGSSSFRSQIRELLAKQKSRIVLDISKVSYIDSSGIGELVSSFGAVRQVAGRLTLCHPRMKWMDVMTITKLLAAFDVVSSVEEALTTIKSNQLHFLCRVSECETWSPLRAAASTEYEICALCGSLTKLRLGSEQKNATGVSIERVRIPTYRDEFVTVIPGTPCRVEVVGRLDLFAFNSVRKAAFTIGRAVFDLAGAEEISEPAARSLVELLLKGESVIFIPETKSFPTEVVADRPIVCHDQSEAVQAHFLAIEKAAKRDGVKPVFGGGLGTYLLH